MGWWSINNIEEGGIDWSEQGKSLYNGDSPADILGDAINKVIKEYQRAWNRKPYTEEIQAAWNFVARDVLEELEHAPGYKGDEVEKSG